MTTQDMKELLKREYGIENYEQLVEAIRQQEKVDIGIFNTAACGNASSKKAG